ncbi:MAG: hypothetical protein ABEH88_04800 [Halobacteriales archaeon]
MDTDKLLELAPHYLALVVLIFAVLAAVEFLVGGVALLIELVTAGTVAFLYRPIVVRLGIAPSIWE